MYNVAAIIVTYNTGKEIREVYNAIEKQVNKIIFVDNASNIETINELNNIKMENKKVITLLNNENIGIAAAINDGIKVAQRDGCDFVITLDHDSIAPENMIKDMINKYNELNNKHKIGIICPAIYDINKEDFLVKVSSDEHEFISEPIQSGSLYKVDIFNEIGYFNKELFIYYVDTEFDYRIKRAGYEILQCNRVILRHEEGKKNKITLCGKDFYYNNYNEFAVYYRARNNVYMLKEYYKEFTSKDRLIKDFFKILIFDKNKVKKIRAHIKGIKDGIFFKKV